MKKTITLLIAVLAVIPVTAQSTIRVEPSVDLKRYSGLWYEVARLPNFFERKLKCATATYTLRNDGKITVKNQGHYLTDPSRTSSISGVAWVPDIKSPGKLKVEFFWPFSSDYWIMYLDQDYQYVMVGEPSLRYLWIMSRERTLDDDTLNMLILLAQKNGYDVSRLIKVEQACL
jgi:apolipoprotein D and lipocalin family protein